MQILLWKIGMMHLNDTHKTHIDLTKQNLESVSYRGYLEIQVEFRLQGVLVETSFLYNSTEEAKADFDMLIKMIGNEPTLLNESF